MFEEKRVIKSLEFVFIDGKLVGEVHALYHDCILKDGIVIASSNYREVIPQQDALNAISIAESYIPLEGPVN